MRTHPAQTAAVDPNKRAFVVAETAETLSYADLVRRSNQAAHLFAWAGIGAGDTVAYLLENQIRYAELCWAAKNSGLYYICLSTQLNLPDLAYIVENSDAKLIVVSGKYAEAAQLFIARFGQRLKILLIDDSAPPDLSYEHQLAQQPTTALQGRSRGASMLYSSGTTGRPKAVRPVLEDLSPTVPPRRHQGLVDSFAFSEDMVFINPGPLYHAGPLRMMMSVHRLGGTVVLTQRFDPMRVLNAIEQYRATHGFFVPTMFVRMLRLRNEGAPIPDLSSLRCVIHGAAPCPVSVKEAMLAWWGPIIHELYGGTESIGQTAISPAEWLSHKGSVGRPPASCKLRILDDAGQELGPHQTGRIYMSNGNRFSYFRDEDKTREAQTSDGFVTLGDVGYVDEDGYLYLTDRSSHMIISGGVNIYPQEAENILIEHPAIADVAVIGVPNAEYGEEVKAVVQPSAWPDDPDALAADIIGFCRARLSAIKCPRSVDFVRELPRSDAGKLLKREIRKTYWAGHETLIS